MSPIYVPFECEPKGQPQYLVVIMETKIKELEARKINSKKGRLYIATPPQIQQILHRVVNTT